MHIVAHVRDHERQGRQHTGRNVGRELIVGTLLRMGEVREVGAGVVLALVEVVRTGADRAPDRGQVLAIRLPRQPRRLAVVAQVRGRVRRSRRRTVVVRDPEGAGGPQRQVVRLGRVGHRVRLRERCVLADQGRDVGKGADLVVAVVLHHHDDHVVQLRHGPRRGRAGRDADLKGKQGGPCVTRTDFQRRTSLFRPDGCADRRPLDDRLENARAEGPTNAPDGRDRACGMRRTWAGERAARLLLPKQAHGRARDGPCDFRSGDRLVRWDTRWPVGELPDFEAVE